MAPTFEPAEVTLATPCRDEDRTLAAAFGIRTANRIGSSWQVVRCAESLELVGPEGEAPLVLPLGNLSPALRQRLRTASRRDPLARAVGLFRHGPRTIVDATGGLCRDAMMLAHLGCMVTAIEQVPVFALAGTLAARAAGLADRLIVVFADAVPWLTALAPADRPAVVYLDPMYEDGTRAQVKKEMQVCRALCGPAADTAGLFAAASAAATDRVVVKRHPGLPPLGGEPAFAATGPRVRFDVYIRN